MRPSTSLSAEQKAEIDATMRYVEAFRRGKPEAAPRTDEPDASDPNEAAMAAMSYEDRCAALAQMIVRTGRRRRGEEV
jgi:hypothetical protein